MRLARTLAVHTEAKAIHSVARLFIVVGGYSKHAFPVQIIMTSWVPGPQI